MEKFAMSLFRTIFAYENGREVATLGFVFTECLRYGFALPSHPEAKNGGRHKQGNNRPPLTNPTKDRAVGGNKSVWLF